MAKLKPSEKTIVKPIPAATVLLLRNAEAGVQVFMQQRSFQASFVGGAYVFPGGKLDPEDYLFRDTLLSFPGEADRRVLLQKPDARANTIAAIRECYEEAGILLAYDAEGSILDFTSDARATHFEGLRDQLNRDELMFSELCESEQLTLAMDKMAFVGHWITPESSSQRFDTLFFASITPAQQRGSHDDYESIDSVWWTAEEALAKYHANAIQLITPTVRCLEHLSTFEKAEDFFDHHRQGLSVLGR